MFFVVAHLDGAAAVRLFDRPAHGAGNAVRVHDDVPVHVTGGAPDRLNQRSLTAEEALLVGVQNRNERDFRNVKSLAQKVDADQHVELAETEVADDLHPLDGFDLMVNVFDFDAVGGEIFGQVFRHFFRHGGDQHFFPSCGGRADLADEVVNLSLNRSDGDLGVDKSRRADQLFDGVRALRLLIRSRGRADEDDLSEPLLELIEEKRTVVKRGRQAKTVLDKILLSRIVAAAHPPHLRQGNVRLVDEHNKIIGKIVEKRIRRTPRCTPRKNAGIVLDTRAKANFS